MKPPKKWKMAVLVWIAIYPVITIIFILFGEYLMQIPYPAVRTLIMTLVLVPLMVFVLLPFLQRLLKNWLSK